MTTDPNYLGALALALGAAGVLLLAGLALLRMTMTRRSEKTLRHALDERAAMAEALAARAAQPGAAAMPQPAGGDVAAQAAKSSRLAAWRERAAKAGERWLGTSFGQRLVADEDRRLLEQCGFVDARSRGLFLYARIACAFVLPVAVAVAFAGRLGGRHSIVAMVVALVAGFMAPKIYISRRASARRRSVIDELPLFVDMLRLLQGVGLSLDQSIQVITNDFRTMLPVLSWELGIAQRQFAAGRTREQSLQRLSSSFDNEDLYAIVRLIVQVDRHGGAVQEPLKQFGDRLREGRRASLRERIGRLTVKMTGVMILTLLPALLIVTAGPGVMAVTRALAGIRH